MTTHRIPDNNIISMFDHIIYLNHNGEIKKFVNVDKISNSSLNNSINNSDSRFSEFLNSDVNEGPKLNFLEERVETENSNTDGKLFLSENNLFFSIF
jgi:hypothetical protein